MSSLIRRFDPVLVSTAFEVFAAHCGDRGHELCGGTGACIEQLALLADATSAELESCTFDASRAALEKRLEQPSASWTTTALLRTVFDLILTPPTNNWLWRSITITTALARLGERGLSPDAVVRTGVGPDLTRRILLDTAAFWVAERDSALNRTDMPRPLQGWAALIDGDPSLANRELSWEWFGHVVQTSAVAERAQNWLVTAAVGHLLGWQVDEYLQVSRGPDEMVFPGGKHATRWVCDRLIRTYLSEWHAASLQWELAYILSPLEIATSAGVNPAILAERTCTEEMVIQELCQRVRSPGVRDSIQTELLAEDLIPSLGLLLQKGRCDVARAQARRAFEAYPNRVEFHMAYAFCTIPQNREEVRRLLEPLQVDDAALRVLVCANLATCALFDGDAAGALDLVAEVTEPVGGSPMWLWDPARALRGEAEVHLETLDDWLVRLRSALAQST